MNGCMIYKENILEKEFQIKEQIYKHSPFIYLLESNKSVISNILCSWN